MAGIGAIHGVDDTLKVLAKDAVKPMGTNAPKITVGPLDSSGSEPRLNWFLYRIDPHHGYRNMEPPRSGWRTSRGRPPLALELHYLLTAFPGSGVTDGDQEQFSHAAIAAVMQALNQNAVIGEGDAALSQQAKPLVEPLRITLDSLDLEALSKLWTAASQPMRLSVGYEVSLVVVQDDKDKHVAGPPVRTRRVAVAPSTGPRLVSVTPPRTAAGSDVVIAATGLTSGAAFTLAREPEDPSGAGDWTMTVTAPATPAGVTLRVPRADLAPGARRLDVTTTESGLPVGRDSIGVTVVPTIVAAPATATPAALVELTTAHAAADVEVFLRGRLLAPTAVEFVSPTTVRITIPGGTASGPAPLALRANKVAGPTFDAFAVTP